MVKYRCNRCGREFPNKTPHKCLTGFQKRHLTYTRVYEGKSLFEEVDSNTKSPWISIKEKLPPEEEYGLSVRVLVLNTDKNIGFGRYDYDNKIWLGPGLDMEFTHWMPIPELKYSPFKTKEECWNEMLKHQPFGYLTDSNGNVTQVNGFNFDALNEFLISISCSPSMFESKYLYAKYKFTDGTPFGIKEE